MSGGRKKIAFQQEAYRLKDLRVLRDPLGQGRLYFKILTCPINVRAVMCVSLGSCVRHLKVEVDVLTAEGWYLHMDFYLHVDYSG